MSSLSTYSSPRLPWEVLERIIGHSSNRTILNCSLICCDLRLRSLCLLVADITFYDRDMLFDFCDFLKAKPHLKPLVHSLLVDPRHFCPFPLLYMLPNLSKIKLGVTVFPPGGGLVPVTINQSTLTSCRLLSTNIQSLTLFDLQFQGTSIQFLHALSAFTSIIHLVCSDVYINCKSELLAPLDVAQQRLAQKLHLRTLAITYSRGFYSGRDEFQDRPSVGRLLLDSGLVQATVESITVDRVYRSTRLPQQFDWPRLRSLTLKLKFSNSDDWEIRDCIKFLEDFHHLILNDVTIEVHEGVHSISGSTTPDLAHHADLFGEMERTLLRFCQVRVLWVIDRFPMGRSSSKVQEVKNRFPVLLQHGALAVVPNTAFHTEHTSAIETLILSSDSKWVASRSDCDGTIALWDIANGALIQRWVPDDNASKTSLAFSPNSQFLMSATFTSSYSNLVVWDLHGNLSQVLKGPVATGTSGATECAWSPVGDVIACAGFRDDFARLWDTNTFQPLHVLKNTASSRIVFVVFSPDGRWLLTGCHLGSYNIWDVASGTGRQIHTPLINPIPFGHIITPTAAFNPTSTRFVISSATGVVEILETGEEQSPVVLECGTGRPGWMTRDLAFSPDGNLVLTVQRNHPPPNTMKIWDAYTGIELLSLEGHKNGIWTACFSPCGKYIASASDDHTVRLWRTSDGSCVATLSDHESKVTCVVFSPDGKALISGVNNGSVIIRQMCNVLPIDERDP